LNYLWQFLRCGELGKAIELCRKFKQFWRAATLNGGAYVSLSPLYLSMPLSYTSRHFTSLHFPLRFASYVCCVRLFCRLWHDEQKLDQRMSAPALPPHL
jgi:hypothetical protein